ncbi:nucleoside/nucleotide kinase family protein [Clavibacter michiganensis]|uniref:nucleoside/nucleotide kinase family protein n=1 Tax=Clavibacter michiganensis TaxID=28447 RepID=UPI000A370C5E|nr:nucleoside/nucleotide kinase family protein [Clavibacter michiganensis]MWJ19629.1 nucleoside/nucleotide kinase family protein [Clavibacter michiganensis subsp. michiganensis]OUD91727.1 nucleoside triphosphate hydrolase domain-containing protein [Clavibacter michiganensis subsp. michiganensis]OUD98845.1 nucleoside triphosphate hydrolase domain-containing protein [Clavibacter michiganensis subsp. michiganensis]OUE05638.1 nucleoside triphosphate hydrolase domain-containing protein [Clavibacter 
MDSGPDRRPHPASPATGDLDALAHRAIGLVQEGRRAILAIAGSPGAGKTTLARALVARVDELSGDGTAACVPMDGFHLANATLDRLGRHDRKGAIDTFDGWGVLALVRRLRVETDHVVYAPSFDRSVDEGVAGAVAVDPRTRLVVLEGNYLLVDEDPWGQLAAELDEAWFCATPGAERFARLVDRHTAGGRAPSAAEAWAREVDGANAALIEATRGRADLVVDGTAAGVPGAIGG